MFERFAFVLIVVVPMLIYLYAVIWLKRPKDYRDFLQPMNKVPPSAFANTSTAFNLQVAALSFFFLLGFASPLAAIINIVFWGVGIFFFRVFSYRLLPFYGRNISIMRYLAEKYDFSPIRSLATFVVCLGFMGLLLAELLFGSMVFLALGLSQSAMIALAFIFGIFIFFYYTRGGHLSVIHTDEWQLFFSYLGFFSILGWALVSASLNPEKGFHTSALIVGFLLLLLLAVSLKAQRQGVAKYSDTTRWSFLPERLVTGLFIAMLIFLLGIVLFDLRDFGSPKVLITVFIDGIGNFDTWTYISAFLLTPLFWHFGDATHWHRLAALRVKDSEATESEVDLIKKGLKRYGWQSPITIALIACLGMLMHFTTIPFVMEDAEIVVMSLPEKLFQFHPTFIIGSLFAVAVIAIMLSTVDGFLATTLFLVAYDLWPSTRRLIDRHSDIVYEKTKDDVLTDTPTILRKVRSLGLVMIALGLLAYFILVLLEIDLFAWLFLGFSFPLCLVPSVIGAFLIKDCSKLGMATFISIFVGLVAGIITFVAGLYNTFWNLLTPLMTIASAALVYGVAVAIKDILSLAARKEQQ